MCPHAPTREASQLDLDDIHQREGQENAAHSRSNGGQQNSQSQKPVIDGSRLNILRILSIKEDNVQLEPVRYETGEEEAAEGQHLKNQKVSIRVQASLHFTQVQFD